MLAVVGFHAFPTAVQGGFVGVDIFFVISGFLITGILQKDLLAENFGFWPYIGTFYQRRIGRIFPALLVVLAASFASGWLLLLPADFKTLGKHMLAGAGFASNLVYWQEAGYFDAAAETKTLLHLWSLAVEEQFYLIWPLALWAAWKLRLKLVWVVAAALVISFAWNVSQVQTQPVATFYSPLTRFWELLAGALLAVLALNKPAVATSTRVQNLKSTLGLLLFTAGIYLLSKDKRFPGWWAMLPVLGSYLIISAGPQAWVNRVILSHRAMVGIGLISYPLYLWHWPLLAFLRGTQLDAPSAGMVWAAIVASFVLAYLTYRFIEKPLRFGTLWQGQARLKTGLLLLTMVAAAAAGYAVYTSNGVSSRFPAQLRSLLDYQYDHGESNGQCMVGMGAVQTDLAPYCVTKNFENNPLIKKSVALWGDSYTWHLAAALNNRGAAAQQGKLKFNLIASAGCAPILNADTEPCKKGNAFVLETLQKQQFDTVLMAGNWVNEHLPELDATLQKLQDIEASPHPIAKDIYLVGPPPGWPHSLLKTVINVAMQDAPQHRLPERLRVGAGTDLHANFELDKKMRAAAQRHGIHYISLLDILCNADGCLTKLGDAPDALVGYDQGHLSLLGAEFVVKQFPAALFQ